MTCPRPQKSLGPSRTRSRVFTSGRAPEQAHSPPCHPVEPARPARIIRNRAGQPRSCGQDQAGRAGPDGSRISPGSGAQPLRPLWRRQRRQVLAWRSGRAPGRVLRDRPCLTRAERTKRSGPVCARGSSRGGSGGPGARLWPSVVSWSWSSASAVRHSTPLAAALTCARLRLTRRRPQWPLQVRTWPAPPFLATLYPAGPCLAWSPAHAPELVREPRPARFIRPTQSPPLDTHTHTHTHTCPGARLLGANIDSEEAERPSPRPRLGFGAGAPPRPWRWRWRGGVGDLGASGTTPDVTFPPTCLGERGGGAEDRGCQAEVRGNRRWVS